MSSSKNSIKNPSRKDEEHIIRTLTRYTDPWSREHQHRGQLRFDMETLTAVFKRSHELGFTVHVHAIGDGALAMTLDAIKRALAETGPHDYRDAVTHLQVVDKADMYYGIVTRGGHGKASDCLRCGKCEKVCPQHLPIRELLKNVAKTFEG